MTKIVVVGSLNMDLVVQVPTIPKPGETVLGCNFATYPGGKGANQAVAAARLGATVTMIGQVGDDSHGKSLLENLAVEGVITNLIKVDNDNATGVAMISVDAQGQNSIAVASGANFSLTKGQVENAWGDIGDIDVLVMPLETPPETILTAATLAKKQSATVVLNPAPARPLKPALLELVDVLVPNQHELEMLSNTEITPNVDFGKAADNLFSLGVRNIVTTLGGDGVAIFDSTRESILISPYSVEVVDTTAAGDAFVAALAVGLGEGKNLMSACHFANAAGALAVTKVGAQPSLPFRSDVEKLVSSSLRS
jgi:ribokinase